MRAIRGAEIGMIFQDPLSGLHPCYRVGWQIVEMIRLHDHEISKDQARQRAVELLRLVGIPRPEQRVRDYPHQFSGGMRQRAMIAMAMALNPALLVADEPTTALDVTVQAQVLQVIRRLQETLGTAVILVTHDLGVVTHVANEVLVMYGGRVMERQADGRCSLPAIIRTPRACCNPCPPMPAGASGCTRSRVSRRACSTLRPAARSRRAASTSWTSARRIPRSRR